jgi:hypothetical protein
MLRGEGPWSVRVDRSMEFTARGIARESEEELVDFDLANV